jgi:hypothetical protein
MNKCKKNGDLVDILSKLIPDTFRISKTNLRESPIKKRTVY